MTTDDVAAVVARAVSSEAIGVATPRPDIVRIHRRIANNLSHPTTTLNAIVITIERTKSTIMIKTQIGNSIITETAIEATQATKMLLLLPREDNYCQRRAAVSIQCRIMAVAVIGIIMITRMKGEVMIDGTEKLIEAEATNLTSKVIMKKVALVVALEQIITISLLKMTEAIVETIVHRQARTRTTHLSTIKVVIITITISNSSRPRTLAMPTMLVGRTNGIVIATGSATVTTNITVTTRQKTAITTTIATLNQVVVKAITISERVDGTIAQTTKALAFPAPTVISAEAKPTTTMPTTTIVAPRATTKISRTSSNRTTRKGARQTRRNLAQIITPTSRTTVVRKTTTRPAAVTVVDVTMEVAGVNAAKALNHLSNVIAVKVMETSEVITATITRAVE